MKCKYIVIADLDGTIALCDHRRHFVEGPKKDWDAFFKACVDDTPNEPVITTLQALDEAWHQIIIVSGRAEDVREHTKIWLGKQGRLLKRYKRPGKTKSPSVFLQLVLLCCAGRND